MVKDGRREGRRRALPKLLLGAFVLIVSDALRIVYGSNDKAEIESQWQVKLRFMWKSATLIC